MFPRKNLVALFSILVIVYLLSLANFDLSMAGESGKSNNRDTVESYLGFALDTNDHFMASGNCDGCHGYDETGHASVDEEGNDISPITTWRATMMANSGKDPFFRAKMSHESAVNPQHQAALEDKCTSCHAPLGRFSNHFYDYGPYGLSDLETDAMGQDGVSCMACHKQTDENLGANHSGNLYYDTAMVEYGPFEKPLQGPMQGFVGVSPEYSPHVTKAGFCAGCHTLLTNSVDLQGAFTGTTFVEQATYHEWLNSSFSQEIGGITCQGCHMPRVDIPVVIAANYLILDGRTPFGKHDLVGGNSFMLKLMKTYREELDIRANEVHFDSTIIKTLVNLQSRSVNIQLEHDGFENDTAYFSLTLQNLTGHKFPSGYPSRRAFVEFVVMNEQNDTVFKTGILNTNYELNGEDGTFETHYNVISSEDQVQIYEMVMGNVVGNVTTILEQAFQPLKDNRLVPVGFSTSHSTYDTTAVVGNAFSDTDFNFDGFEGSGADIIHFHVPLDGSTETLHATARMWYQSVPKKWTQEMFSVSTPQIDTFRVMFNTADHTPVLVASDSLSNLVNTTSVESYEELEISVYPNPSNDVVWITGLTSNEITIYERSGKVVYSGKYDLKKGITLPRKSGIYLIKVQSDSVDRIFKVIRL